jgi:hypothetical protein
VAKIIEGDRIGKLGKVTLGCVVVIFDLTRVKALFTRRTDNGRCVLPGWQSQAIVWSNPAAGLVPISHGGHIPAHSSCEQEKRHDAYGKQRRHRLTPRNRHVFSPHGSFTPKASSRRVCRHQQVNHGPGGIPAQPYLAAIDEVNHRCQHLLIVRCYLAHCLN